MRRAILFFFVIAFLLLAVACTGGQSATPTTVAPTLTSQPTITPTYTVIPPSETVISINTPTKTPRPTSTQTPTVTPTSTITPTPTETLTPTATPTPWLIWFGGNDCQGSTSCDSQPYSYSILSDGTGLERFSYNSIRVMYPMPTLPASIQMPVEGEIIFWEYSPDQSKALIIINRHGGLFLVDFANEQVTLLQPAWKETEKSVNVACWSADGSYIRFFLSNTAYPIEVYKIKLDGDDKQLLFKIPDTGAGGYDIFACSPDGEEIAFTSGRGLYSLDLKIGKVIPLLRDWRIMRIYRAPTQP
jgi:hypothetical protein